ncbi:TPA: hypothetical protein EYP44_02730 [Candidatus Bathyarchaeota archaeon]|nr:hypothetical protein [Candidatus Bathyarchaeota archaeon]
MAEDVESILHINWDLPRKPYPPKVITLVTGDRMVVREASREEVPSLLEAIRPLLTVERDYYDIVSARVYAELLGWYRYRVRNEYCLIGVINGELAGIANNRLVSDRICMSLHTLALKRGLRVGAHLFAAKQEHAVENYGVDEVWVTIESPIGFRRFTIEWGLEPRPEVQHELGGARCWALTKENYYRLKPKLVFGERPVPEELYSRSLRLKIPTPDVMRQE